jgi:acid phosphatase family membrane protein YuiD
MAALIGFKEGIAHPAFGVAVTLAFIVMLDANSLRRQVGKHAVVINKLTTGSSEHQALRERMGHTVLEIAAGIAVGIAVAAAVHAVLG